MQDAGQCEEPISCLTETNIQRVASLNLPENATGRPPSSGNASNEAREVDRYPLRPSKPDCSYYLKTGYCKFGCRCRFNHPQEKRLQLDFGLQNGISSENKVSNFQTLKTTSYNCFPVLDASKPYAPAMSFSQWLDLYMDKSSCLHSRKISSSAKTTTCSSSALNQNSIMKLVDASIHMKVTVDESSCESPGEHQSQNGMRYHPLQLQPCHLSPVGLPLRPDQPLCKYYGRFGICKYGPACEFDHPVDDGNRNDESSQMSL